MTPVSWTVFAHAGEVLIVMNPPVPTMNLDVATAEKFSQQIYKASQNAREQLNKAKDGE